MIVAPTQSNILAMMRAFLLAVLPSGVEIIAAQPNRVPEPKGKSFVIMSAPNFRRLTTNLDSYADVSFTASIAGTLMTVTDVDHGTIKVGATIFGVGVSAGTIIGVGGSGVGGVGTYTVSPSQIVASGVLASGSQDIMQAAEATVQLDFHSPDGAAGDWAQTVTTLMRDDFAVQQFANQTPNYGVVPLFADDAMQMPFENAEQQTEWRWVVQAFLQANQVVSIPQQFADSADLTIVSVEAEFSN